VRVLGVSERFACRALGASRSMVRRPPRVERVDDPDADLRALLRATARKNPRWGYRHGVDAARAEGFVVNHKRVERLWREEGLRVKRRTRRKRAGIPTAAVIEADAPNTVWAVDFQFDVDNNGRAIKIASIVDEHTRESLGGLVERSITAERLIGELDRIAMERGVPLTLRADNGPELASAAMADWATERIGLAFIPPGSPWKNAYIESFNGRLRDECLNVNAFYSLTHARVVIDDWKNTYNHDRGHGSLGRLTPDEYARQCKHQHQEADSH
jgi:putative transposase